MSRSSVPIFNVTSWGEERYVTLAQILRGDGPIAGVYFIQAGYGPIKIGLTEDLGRRLIALQTGHYEKLRVRLILQTGTNSLPSLVELERSLHETFRELWLSGEWFDAGSPLTDFVERPRRFAYLLHTNADFLPKTSGVFPDLGSLLKECHRSGVRLALSSRGFWADPLEKLTPGLEMGLYEHKREILAAGRAK